MAPVLSSSPDLTTIVPKPGQKPASLTARAGSTGLVVSGHMGANNRAVGANVRHLISAATALLLAWSALPAAAADRATAQLRLVEPPRRVEPAVSRIEIASDVATKVGRQVWLNETGGDRDMITAWNPAEDFASVGIGHFIWFPEGLQTRFAESFPKVLAFLRAQCIKPPAWLDREPAPHCPWRTRAEFKRNFDGRQMRELRAFLHDTVGPQTQYLVERMKAALPKILESLPSDEQRAHVKAQFHRVVDASPDLYPLIDYINFKGEGIAASETYPSVTTGEPEGWGLKHVLLSMTGASKEQRAVLGEFADAAAFVLKRRIHNNPPNRRWEKGWLKRTETYRRPLR